MIKITGSWGNVNIFKERVSTFNFFQLENIKYNITPIVDKKAEERLLLSFEKEKEND